MARIRRSRPEGTSTMATAPKAGFDVPAHVREGEVGLVLEHDVAGSQGLERVGDAPPPIEAEADQDARGGPQDGHGGESVVERLAGRLGAEVHPVGEGRWQV